MATRQLAYAREHGAELDSAAIMITEQCELTIATHFDAMMTTTTTTTTTNTTTATSGTDDFDGAAVANSTTSAAAATDDEFELPRVSTLMTQMRKVLTCYSAECALADVKG